MKIPILWCFVCLVFGYFSLDTLFEESHEVVYENGTQTDLLEYLVCKELNWFCPQNKTKIDLKELRGELLRHFNDDRYHHRMRIKTYRKQFEAMVLNQTKSGGYLISHGMLCLIANDSKAANYINRFFLYEKNYFAIERKTFSFTFMNSLFTRAHQLSVTKKGHPYSNCGESNARFHCLNGCFKRSFRLSRYFYDGNETGLIYLNYSHRRVQESEQNCFQECKKEDCKVVQLIPGFLADKAESFVAEPKLGEIDYWLQLIGLVCSLAGLSAHEFTCIVIQFIASKVRGKKARISFIALKLAIFLLSLALCGLLFAQKILDHKAKESAPFEIETRTLIKPSKLHLAICVEIPDIYDYFEAKTMREIEKVTDGMLNDTLKGIYLSYRSKSFPVNYQVHSRVLFSHPKRCFLLTIHPSYETIPSNPKLTISTVEDTYSYKVYLLSEDEHLNQESFPYSGGHTFVRRIVKRLKSSGDCVDYAKKYTYCASRLHCVERCINRKFVKQYNQTTFGLLNYFPVSIDKEWFRPAEWNQARPIIIQSFSASEDRFETIQRECLQKYPDEKLCEEDKFESTTRIKSTKMENGLEIELRFDVVQTIEESPSIYKLVLDLVSIQGIFFGLTVLGILKPAYSLVQAKVRRSAFGLFVVYLLCSIGFSWHVYHIVYLVTSGDLVITRHHELTKKIQMPEIVFCLSINEKLIDPNHKLTGNYLNALTVGMTKEGMFKNITYLNESNEWIALDFELIKQFFYLDMKCFSIRIEQVYDRDQFHFSTDRLVLNVNFSKNFEANDVYSVDLMTKAKETQEFSKIVSLEYSWNPNLGIWTNDYLLTQEITVYKYEDRFAFLRRHFLSFQDGDLYGQLLELRDNKHSLTTLNLPLETGQFDLELVEDLFEQLFLVHTQTERYQLSSEGSLVFAANHLESNIYGSDFSFNLVFLQKIIFSTNEENFGMLILSLLNLLSIWFDLGVLDLHPFFPLFHNYFLVFLYCHLPIFLFVKINQLMLFSQKWLKKIESPLNEILQPKK